MLSFDFHIHTHHSIDSSMDPSRIVKIAMGKGLDGIAVTDHNTIKGGLEAAEHATPEFHVIVGSEVRTEAGEIVGLFLTEEIKSTDSFEVMEDIKSQGGLIILPHPFRTIIFPSLYQTYRLNQSEIVEKIDAIEVVNARTFSEANRKAFLLAKKMNKPMIAGSDAHFYPEIGRARTLLPPFNDEKELKTIIAEGKTIVENGSQSLLSTFSFNVLGFLYSRTRKLSQRLNKIMK